MNIAGAPGGIQVRQSWACVSARFSAETTSITPFIPKKMSEDLRDSTIPVPGVQFQL